ncbi:SymE family type I addiction module toxin [Taibaiella helva]|uniref:SymE family type I addiction module toxin n=1 Tax=Taibaiella helva TaxID=2301235 RepID=UPI000E57AC6B
MQTINPTTANKLSARRITVCGKQLGRFSGRRYVRFPIISLTGKWLQDSGFKIGHVVDVVSDNGKITITLSKEQPHFDYE